jgi:hypothetical protein
MKKTPALALSLIILAAPFSGGHALEEAVSDTIWGSETWTFAASPYLVNVELVIGSGGMLTIEPGVVVQLTVDGAILVEGTLEAAGTDELPIHFLRADVDPWKAVVNLEGGSTLLQHCILEGGDVWGPFEIGTVAGFGGNLTVHNCEIYFTARELIHATAQTVLDIQDNILHDGLFGLRLSFGCSGLIQGNTIWNVKDGMNIDRCNLEIRDNHVYDCILDGIDFDVSRGSMIGNVVHGCGDAGYTISWALDVILLENNLGYNCGRALQVKNGSTALVYNCTFADSEFGIEAFELFAGDGGGIVNLRNSIVWGNDESYYVDELSVLDAIYCDIELDQSVYPGDGNLNEDPLFRFPDNGNYDILASSPCIDAGTSTGAPELDIHGDARWDDPDEPNTGGGAMPYYDIGCDEYRGEVVATPPVVPIATGVTLARPYPNPFSHQSVVSLRLPHEDGVTASVVGPDGRAVRRLLSGRQGPGTIRLVWDGRDDGGSAVGSGYYFLLVRTESQSSPVSRRLLLIR